MNNGNTHRVTKLFVCLGITDGDVITIGKSLESCPFPWGCFSDKFPIDLPFDTGFWGEIGETRVAYEGAFFPHSSHYEGIGNPLRFENFVPKSISFGFMALAMSFERVEIGVRKIIFWGDFIRLDNIFDRTVQGFGVRKFKRGRVFKSYKVNSLPILGDIVIFCIEQLRIHGVTQIVTENV